MEVSGKAWLKRSKVFRPCSKVAKNFRIRPTTFQFSENNSLKNEASLSGERPQ